ncbi:MAG: acyl-CoA/acyl-ACP dehydrogenase [Desulfobacterales bacterium]|nr:acyl-CoA/acyl-ACP dehydrogenase [Desulfobacterales bacterium]
MNYDLNTEQKMLKDSARKFFSKEADSIFIREMAKDEKGYSKAIWKKMAKLDWMGILIPEEYEGSEMGLLDMVVLLNEMGYACFTGPFVPTAVLGVTTLLEGADDKQKKSILPKIALGKKIVTLAWAEESGQYTSKGVNAKAEVKDDSYVISGTKLYVPDANNADIIICAARTDSSSENSEDGISLFIVDAQNDGLNVEVLKTIQGDKLCEVSLNNVKVPKENLVGEEGKGWDILKKVLLKAAVAKSAEMIGGGRKVLEMTVDYAKQRNQFGQPIGSFQAIQHHCADMLTYLETSEYMTYQAAWLISEGLSYEKEASMAKAWVSDSYHKLVALGHQVIGGVGFMEEFDIQLYLRQSKTAELAFGDADFHRELVAQELGL